MAGVFPHVHLLLLLCYMSSLPVAMPRAISSPVSEPAHPCEPAVCYATCPLTCLLTQVKWDHLHGALDRFSSFFICPRFDNSSVDREVKAVDSEFYNNLQDDVSMFKTYSCADDHT